MKYLSMIYTIALCFVLPAMAQESTNTEIDFPELSSYIEEQMQIQNIPGLAIAIVQADEIVYAGGFGVRSTETNDPVTTDTLFRIGSTTKPLTTIGLLMLVENGQVDLDESVSSYIPEFEINDAITVRHLLSHTAGLNDQAIVYGSLDPDSLGDFVEGLPEGVLFAEAGELHSYSNPGFNIAGYIIEAVTGQYYADYMQSEVFPVLEMNRSTFYSNVAMTYPFAIGYQAGASQTVRPNPDNVAEYPSGFAFSSVNDLANLMEMILNDGVLNENIILDDASINAMQTPAEPVLTGNMQYGLGLFINEYRGTTSIGHAGNINGYSSFMEMLPEHDLGVVILANSIDFDPSPIWDTVVDFMLDLPELSESDSNANLAELSLADYLGDFALTEFTGELLITIQFRIENEQLLMFAPGQPQIVFNPIAPDVFEGGGFEIEFIRDEIGRVSYIIAGFRAAPRID